MKFQKYYAVKIFFKNNTPSASRGPTGTFRPAVGRLLYCRPIRGPAHVLAAADRPVGQPQANRPAASQSACSKPTGSPARRTPPFFFLLLLFLPFSSFLLFSSLLPENSRIYTQKSTIFLPICHRGCIVGSRGRQGKPRSTDGVARGGRGEQFFGAFF